MESVDLAMCVGYVCVVALCVLTYLFLVLHRNASKDLDSRVVG